MFNKGLFLLKRNTEWSIFFPNLPYLVLLDMIILVGFWTYGEHLFLNQLLRSQYTFVEGNTKVEKNSILIRNFSHGVKGIPTTVHPWAQSILSEASPGHKEFILRPSMDPGLSSQVFYGFCQGQGWDTGLCCSKLSLVW